MRLLALIIVLYLMFMLAGCGCGRVAAPTYGLRSLNLSHDVTKEGGVTYGLSDSPLRAVRDVLAMRTCSSDLEGAEEGHQQAADSK